LETYEIVVLRDAIYFGLVDVSVEPADFIMVYTSIILQCVLLFTLAG